MNTFVHRAETITSKESQKVHGIQYIKTKFNKEWIFIMDISDIPSVPILGIALCIPANLYHPPSNSFSKVPNQTFFTKPEVKGESRKQGWC